MSYNTNNYMEQGGEVLHIGGSIEFAGGGLMPNQAAQSGSTAGDAKTSINELLIKLKDAGLMVPDVMTIAVAKCTASADSEHANRAFNTGKVDTVAIADDVITITLASGTKVADLKDFDGGNGWGTHKWLGIGVTAGLTLTAVEYNGVALTEEDATEASTAGGLGSNYFVRWVAADLVLAGDETQKSVSKFTLWSSGYGKRTITLKIVEG